MPRLCSSSDVQVEVAIEALASSVSKYVSRRRKRMLLSIGRRSSSGSGSGPCSNNAKAEETRAEAMAEAAEAGTAAMSEANRRFDRAKAKAMAAARHASHVLRTLTSKRQSFVAGTRALRACSDRCVAAMRRALENGGDAPDASSVVRSVLSFWFSRYVRLRDGLVLMQSGECRHPGDVPLSGKGKGKGGGASGPEQREDGETEKEQQQAYASRLGQLSERNDGYTRLYSSVRGYSGYGWDEFYDEDVGIRRRLLDSLLSLPTATAKTTGGGGMNAGVGSANAADERARTLAWEALVALGAESFEMALDGHDVALREAVDDLESVRNNFLRDANALLDSYGRRCAEQEGEPREGAPRPVAAAAAAAAAVAVAGNKGGGGGGGKISMSTRDKFESLDWIGASALGVAELRISRRADDFVVKDAGGALPSDWDEVRQWERSMKLPWSLASACTQPPVSRERGAIRDGESGVARARGGTADGTGTKAKSSTTGKKKAVTTTAAATILGKVSASSTSKSHASSSLEYASRDKLSRKRRRVLVDSSSSSDDDDDKDGKDKKAIGNMGRSDDKSGGDGDVPTGPKPNATIAAADGEKDEDVDNVDSSEAEPCGLKIQTKKMTTTATSKTLSSTLAESKAAADLSSSCDAIKEQLGFDGNWMRDKLDELEREERRSDAVARADEAESLGFGAIAATALLPAATMAMTTATATDEDDGSDVSRILEDIIEERENVKRRRKDVATQENVLDVWNARECLRESMMTLGNLLLELGSKISPACLDGTARHLTTYLKEAETRFRDSVRLVEEQELGLPSLEGELSPAEMVQMKRNMLLLRGRANVNVGIALVERALVDVAFGGRGRGGPDNNKVHPLEETRNGLFAAALGFVEKGAVCAKTLRDLAVGASSDAKEDSSSVCVLDIIDSVALESLSFQFRGVALWHMKKRKESIQSFKIAAGRGDEAEALPLDQYLPDGDDIVDPTVVDGTAKAWVDFHLAALTLINSTIDEIENIPVRPTAFPSHRKTQAEKGDILLKAAVWGYKRAAETSHAIAALEGRLVGSVGFREYKAKHNVATRSELAAEMSDVVAWWKTRRESLLAAEEGSLPSSRQQLPLDVPAAAPALRGDISRTGGPKAGDGTSPPARFVLGEARATARYKKGSSASVRTRVRRKGSDAGAVLGRNVMKFFEDCRLSPDDITEESPSDSSSGSCTNRRPVYRKWGDDFLPPGTMKIASASALIAFEVSCPNDLPEW